MKYSEVHLELRDTEEVIILPYNDITKKVELCHGVVIFGRDYIIQGAGYKNDNGKLVRTLEASTPEFFKKIAKTEYEMHPLRIIHDLDDLI